MPIPLSDIYWLAGLLEGEGCFTYDKNTSKTQIQLSMMDSDTVLKAAKIMNNRNVHTYFRDGVKDVYRFNVYANLAIQWMMTLYPLMGERRRKKIEEILSRWKNYNSPKQLLPN